MKRAISILLLLLLASPVFAEEPRQGDEGKGDAEAPPPEPPDEGEGDEGKDLPADNPPIPAAEITKININVYPDDVILVKGKMVEKDKLGEHLAGLVEDARKDAVEVILIPFSNELMAEVSEIIRVAKSVGYTRVTYVSAKAKKKELTEVYVLVSRTGSMVVNDTIVKADDLKDHLDKLVAADRREKVSVIVFAGSQSRKLASKAMKIARDLGFTDVAFGAIED